MDKVSLLNQIKTSLEGLLTQTQELEKGGHPLHQIDKDLMLEKTRALYEQMMALENAHREEKVPNPIQKEDVTVIEKITGPVFDEEVIVTEMQTDKSQVVPEAESKKTAPVSDEKAETVDIPVTEEKTDKTVVEVKSVEEKPKTDDGKTEKSIELPKTTLDLFSEASPETLGDMLTPTEKPAVADSLQMSSINDLREAIGINDKFLFINELFNGDLERYNKVIDELNSFSGYSGAQTYLTELQVQYQWKENGQAYQKLNILLERKFA